MIRALDVTIATYEAPSLNYFLKILRGTYKKGIICSIVIIHVYLRTKLSYNKKAFRLGMSNRKIKRGDIVTVKPDWLDLGEDGSTQYVVLEEVGDNRILVQALNSGLTLAPTYVYDVAWVDYAGTVPTEMFKH